MAGIDFPSRLKRLLRSQRYPSRYPLYAPQLQRYDDAAVLLRSYPQDEPQRLTKILKP
jgi:hypothetical protein